ncbi:MAG: hypothetical protein ABI700_08265 [Chloroflexota bacterium]
MTTKFRSVFFVLIALLVVLTTAQVMAASSSAKPANEHEFIGTVTAMTVTTVTISTMTFDIAQAEVNDTILVGDVIKVHYIVAVNGTLVARELELAVEVTPEATGVVDDHGQDDPANHPEDNHNQGNEAGDDNGHDNPANHPEDNHNGSNDNRGQGNGSSQDDGGHHGGNSGHSGHGG